jgi:hypothetical protein
MGALKEELAKKGLAPTDDNAVLYAMFPRETEALYIKKDPAPAPQPAPAAVHTSNGTSRLAAATAAHPVRRFFITINDRRSEVLVEELA